MANGDLEMIGKGIWWVPGSGSRRVRGLLYLVDGRHVIDLEGSLTGTNPFEISRLAEVRGRLDSGVPTVLTDCTHRHGVNGAVVHANHTLRGKIRGQSFRKRFNSISFEVPIWLDFQAFRPNVTHGDGQTVVAESDGAWTFDLGNGCTLRVYTGQGSSSRAYGDRQMAFRWMATATIDSATRQPATTLEAWARRIEQLFGVISGYPNVAATWNLSFQPSAEGFRIDTEFEGSRGPAPQHEDSRAAWLRQEAIVPYWAPNFDWALVIPGWFQLLEQPAARAAAEVLEQHWATREYESNKAFLDYARSLEILHRDHRERLELSAVAAGAVIDSVPENWPDRVKNLLNGNLNGGLEFSFKTRLDRIVAELGPLAYLVGPENTFTRCVRNTRNFYTHLDGKQKSTAWHGRDLAIAAARLELLLRCFLMILAGVSPDLAKLGMASAARTLGLQNAA